MVLMNNVRWKFSEISCAELQMPHNDENRLSNARRGPRSYTDYFSCLQVLLLTTTNDL